MNPVAVFRAVLACLVMSFGGGLVWAQPVRMGEELQFEVVPPWQLVGPVRTFVTELQITNEAGLLVARAVIQREDQLTPERAQQRLLVTAGPVQREGRLMQFAGWPAYNNVTFEPIKNRRGERLDATDKHTVLAFAMDRWFISADVHAFIDDERTSGSVARLMDSLRVRGADDAQRAKAESDLARLRDLRRSPWQELSQMRPPRRISDAFAELPERRLSPPALAVTGWGELELASSWSGRNVVIGTNNGYARSSDFGRTFTPNAGATPVSGAVAVTTGDPSAGYGATGAFYLSYLAQPSGTGTGANGFNGCTAPVAASLNGGATWAWRGDARRCAASVTTGSNCFPDQEHMAADPKNTVSRRVGGRAGALTLRSDQLYMIWREFTAVATSATTTANPLQCNTIGAAGGPASTRLARAACSRDGGRTWTVAPPPVNTSTNYDFSKVTVDRDGRVLSVSALAKDDGWTEIWVDAFTSCANGFQREAGFPHVVGWFQTPTCIPGLDRCSNLGSPSIAVTRDLGNIAWLGASFPTDNNNDRIIVGLSTSGGTSFFGWRELSDAVTSRKFMPWMCASGRHLYATWYDRRPSTSADNSLTDLYLGRMDFEKFGPKVGRNINISAAPDSHCSSGWPAGTRDASSAIGCTVQPQAYGICAGAPGTPGVGGNCTPGTQLSCGPGTGCAAVNNGVPKYGDYSGLACSGGYAFAAWASATAPSGIPATTTVPAGVNVFVRAYQADSAESPFSKWRDKAAVSEWWHRGLEP